MIIFKFANCNKLPAVSHFETTALAPWHAMAAIGQALPILNLHTTLALLIAVFSLNLFSASGSQQSRNPMGHGSSNCHCSEVSDLRHLKYINIL
jgi:hypothetical protein